MNSASARHHPTCHTRRGSSGGSKLRRPRHHAARRRDRDRHGVARGHARGRHPDDRRRPGPLSVDRLRALVGDPDDDDGRLRRQRPDDVRRPVHRRSGDALRDRHHHGHHRRDHEHVRRAVKPRAEAARTPRIRRRSTSIGSTAGSSASRLSCPAPRTRSRRPPMPSRRRRTISVGSTSGSAESKPR